MGTLHQIRLPFTKGNFAGKIAFIGEGPGKDEFRAYERGDSETAFVGRSGRQLDRMLSAIGIPHSECYFTNVVKQEIPEDDITNFDRETIGKWTETLHEELAKMPNVNVLVPLGNIALEAVSGIKTITWNGDGTMKGKPSGIGNWRGSVISGKPDSKLSSLKVISTYHPAYILRVWSNRAIVLADLDRIKEDMHTRKLNLPEHNIIIEPSIQQFREFMPLAMESDRIATDIENLKRQIFCIGVAISENDALCVPFFWPDGRSYWSIEEEREVLMALHMLLTKHKKQIGQFYFHDAYYYHYMCVLGLVCVNGVCMVCMCVVCVLCVGI